MQRQNCSHEDVQPCLKRIVVIFVCGTERSGIIKNLYYHLLFLVTYVFQTHTDCSNARFIWAKRIFSGHKQLKYSTFFLYAYFHSKEEELADDVLAVGCEDG